MEDISEMSDDQLEREFIQILSSMNEEDRLSAMGLLKVVSRAGKLEGARQPLPAACDPAS